jgi:DNA anti-recombination protein RmuC
LITAHQYLSPNTFDFWAEAEKLGDKLTHYTTEQLDNAAATYASAAENIREFKATMEDVVASAIKFRDDVRREGIDLEELSEKFTAEMNTIMEELKAEFSEPLPDEMTPRQEQRDIMLSSALSKVEDALVKVNALWGVSEANSRAHFQEIKPHVKSVLVITGELS